MSMLSLLCNQNSPFSNLDHFTKEFEGACKEMDKVLVPFKKDFERYWSVPTNIHETEKAYVFSFDIPGLKKEDISVELVSNQISIRGERKEEKKSDDAKTHRTECWKGQFRRTFTLPEDADSGKVEAAYENGVLNLTIQKSEERTPKKIQVA